MPRRRGFSFGPKRKSYKTPGMRLNTKGYRATSVSYGGKGARVNISKRGTRINGKSCMLSLTLLILSVMTLAQMLARIRR